MTFKFFLLRWNNFRSNRQTKLVVNLSWLFAVAFYGLVWELCTVFSIPQFITELRTKLISYSFRTNPCYSFFSASLWCKKNRIKLHTLRKRCQKRHNNIIFNTYWKLIHSYSPMHLISIQIKWKEHIFMIELNFCEINWMRVKATVQKLGFKRERKVKSNYEPCSTAETAHTDTRLGGKKPNTDLFHIKCGLYE